MKKVFLMVIMAFSVLALSACDKVINDVNIDENGHAIIVFDDETTKDVGKIVDVHPHTIVEKTIVGNEASCENVGVTYVVCEECGELIRTIVTEKTQHNYEDVVTEPTCTDNGYTTHTCKGCGKVVVDNYVEAIGHTFEEEYHYDTIEHWKYSTCGHTDEMIKGNHTLGDDDICTVCGYDASSINAFTFEKIAGKEEYKITDFQAGVRKALVPAEYNNLPVTEIDSMTFFQNTTIEYVVLPDTIKELPIAMFAGCTSLKSVVLPSDISYISENLFANCIELENITIPEVTSINKSAFSGCKKLTQIEIPSSVKVINENAFDGAGCVELEKGVSYVDTWATGCDTLATKAIIRDNTTGIAEKAFADCRYIESVNIPTPVKYICSNAFYRCENLNDVYITDIESWLNISYANNVSNPFYYAHDLYLNNEIVTSLTIPSTITNIGEQAVYGVKSLESVVIPDSVKSIGNYAFYCCENLSTITICEGITSIGASAFASCSVWIDIYYYGTETQWNNIQKGMNLYSGIYNVNMHYQCDYDMSVLTFEKIDDKEEYRLTAIASGTKNVYIPDKYNGLPVTEITADFNEDIERVIMPSGIKSLSTQMFYGCTSLKYVLLPNVTTLPGGLFEGCTALESIVIPNSVTTIGTYAFSGCENLASVTLSSNLTDIGYYAFSGCSKLKNIVIPEGITSINNFVFYGCSSLDSIVIPASVQSIDSNAFKGCPCVEIVNGIHYVDGWVVGSDENITEAIIREGTIGIAQSAFESRSALVNISIPEGVKYINTDAFKYAPVTTITLPSTLKVLGYACFSTCTSLKTIYIPAGVTTISAWALSFCTSLEDVYYLGTRAQWETISFGENWNTNSSEFTVHCSDDV